ncbi:cellulase family glycosylhydrolase [Dokdonia sp.]|uniref:cellulase family glycosylhydrolase n=1 Tax=Dokdonia sp. TaxID=2024995 RepID=UPI0032675C45
MKINKLTYRSLIIIVFVILNAGVLYGIGQVLAFLNTGADRSQILHLDLTREQYYTPEITWESIENPGRPLEPFNQTKIEQDYLDAWYVRNTAFMSYDQTAIEDHYTQNARIKIYESLQENIDKQIKIENTTLTHDLSLEMYSADGTLAVLTDRNVTSYQRVFQEEQLQYEGYTLSDYRVVLLLEDGVWRVRHIEKIKTGQVSNISSKKIKLSTTIEGMNYYPQDSPWNTFGADFDSTIIREDFKIIKDLRLNTIRIFIGYEDFGGPTVSQEKLDKLQQLLDEASQANLQVIITLFDFYGDYRVSDWTRTQKHLSTIVNVIKDHPALYAWDLKNEADLDFETRGASLVTAWLQQMTQSLRSIDPDHPITIGWSSPEAALTLEKEVDYVSFHYYKDLTDLSKVFTELQQQTDKPIVLEEIGLSSYRGLWNPFGYSEKDQTAFYTELLTIQKNNNISFLSWTLYDFKEIPQQVAGRYPWRRNKQLYFGLIDTNGEKEDAYQIVKDR